MRADETAIGGLLVPTGRLGLVLFHAPAGLIGEAQVELRFQDPLLRRLLEPEIRLEQILPDAATRRIHVADIELRRGETLLGGLQVILKGLPLIRRLAATQFTGETEVELRRSIALLRSRAIPLERLAEVLLYAQQGVGVGIPERVLGFQVSVFRLGAEFLQFCRSRGGLSKDRAQPDHPKQHEASQPIPRPDWPKDAGKMERLKHALC